MPPEPEDLLTPSQVAAMFSVDVKTITRWADAGKLSSIRTLGGHRRYKEAEVRALLAGSARERVTDPLAVPVSTLWPPGASGPEMTVRRNLAAEGVTQVKDLTGQDEAALRALGFKAPQIEIIRRALYRKGLTLRGEVIGTPATMVA